MIKIIIMKGGIGNQLFQYHMYRFLEIKGHHVYYKDDTWKHLSHYGLELDKFFDVKIKELPTPINIGLRIIKHYFPHKYKAITATDKEYKETLFLFDGYWNNKKYMKNETSIKFKNLELSKENSCILNKIVNEESISIHVRRGDYLRPECIKIFGNVCTSDYYLHAIDIIKKNFSKPIFYIFSDDIEWCKENLKLNSAEYVDWNRGFDSIYDMYLMSHCKANIIANSTFSYWGAKISGNNLVVYPKKWFTDNQAPDIFPLNWIGI